MLLLNKNAITVKGPLENKITYIEVFFATLPSLSHTYILCTYVLNFINTKRHHSKCKIMVFKCQKWCFIFIKCHKMLLALKTPKCDVLITNIDSDVTINLFLAKKNNAAKLLFGNHWSLISLWFNISHFIFIHVSYLSIWIDSKLVCMDSS